MIRLTTQFDPPGTHATDAAIAGGCCCCCCCCCIASTVSVSAVAAIRTSKKAHKTDPKPAHAGFWTGLAATALLVAAILAGILAAATSAIAPSADSSVPAWVFGIGTVVLWGILLWNTFRAVGFRRATVRAAAYVVIGTVAFGIELFAGAFLLISVWPLYLILVAIVITIAVMAARAA